MGSTFESKIFWKDNWICVEYVVPFVVWALQNNNSLHSAYSY